VSSPPAFELGSLRDRAANVQCLDRLLEKLDNLEEGEKSRVRNYMRSTKFVVLGKKPAYSALRPILVRQNGRTKLMLVIARNPTPSQPSGCEEVVKPTPITVILPKRKANEMARSECLDISPSLFAIHCMPELIDCGCS